jgi:hypothetical protein
VEISWRGAEISWLLGVTTLAKHEKGDLHHLVFVNKTTKNVASTNSWILKLTALLQQTGHNAGIPSLLPHQKVLRLLESNNLISKTVRGTKSDQVTANVRLEAKAMIPYMAVLFCEKQTGGTLVTKNAFCTWIIEQLQDQSSEVYETAAACGLNDLLENSRSTRWWRDQFKKGRV